MLSANSNSCNRNRRRAVIILPAAIPIKKYYTYDWLGLFVLTTAKCFTMRKIAGYFILFFLSLISGQIKSQTTGTTSVGNDGGGSIHAACTEILAFDNYNDGVAGGVSGQDFLFILQNGDSLFFNLKRTGNSFHTLVPPPTINSSFARFGYLNLTGKCDFYENVTGAGTLTLSNIIVKDKHGNVVNDYTLVGFDGEASTVTSEDITFTAPTGHNWYQWDSISSQSPFCVTTKSGLGTNVAKQTGASCSGVTYWTSFGFAVDSPGNVSVRINGGPSGLEGGVLGIKRIIVSPDDTICNGSPTNFQPVNVPSGTTYTWQAPVVNPASSINGASAQLNPVSGISQTLVNTTNAPATVTYTFQPTSCGLPGNAFTATVLVLPSLYAGPDQSICGDSTNMAATGIGTWSALPSNPAVANIVAPNNPSTAIKGLTVNGDYGFVFTSGFGCADTLIVHVGNSLGTVQLTADQTTFCPGDSAHICAPAGYTTYLWNTGETTSCIYVSTAGNYYVTVTNSSGCAATSNHLAITVKQIPPVSISVNGDTLTAYGALTYQWFFNGAAIVGATGNVLIANQPGTYSVVISDTSGCFIHSSDVIISGLTGEAEAMQLKVYPDPAVNLLNVDYQLQLNTKVEIYITDQLGRRVLDGINEKEQAGKYLQRIDVGRLPAASYTLNILTETGNAAFRFVKQ